MADMTDDSQPAEYIDLKPNTFESLDWEDDVEIPEITLAPPAVALVIGEVPRKSKVGAAAGMALVTGLLAVAYSLYRRSRARL